MSSKKKTKYKKILGFDDDADIYISEKHVWRAIIDEKKRKFYLNLLKLCKKNSFFETGLINTKISKLKRIHDKKYPLLLIHPRIEFVSYPHEWSSLMFYDAAIFHIDLALKLLKYKLIFKDFHPYNILFDFSKLVFTDFTSIIQLKDIINYDFLLPLDKRWYLKRFLNIEKRYFLETYNKMFLPYILYPLYFMHQRRFEQAHKRMETTVMNASKEIIRDGEVFTSILNMERWRHNLSFFWQVFGLMHQRNAYQAFLLRLEQEIKRLMDSKTHSGYVNYYGFKGEEYPLYPSSRWKKKQRVIYSILKKAKLQTILDVGSNTGWFSLLAERLGLRVVAIDIDEASINELYLKAKEDNLKILPLIMNIMAPTTAKYSDLSNENIPLITDVEERFSCDAVLVLALVHHLVLGQGYTFDDIFSNIYKFTKKMAILEFISINDRLIKNEPGFFPFLQDQRSNYSEEKLVKAGMKYFSKIEFYQSHPDTRKIILFRK